MLFFSIFNFISKKKKENWNAVLRNKTWSILVIIFDACFVSAMRVWTNDNERKVKKEKCGIIQYNRFYRSEKCKRENIMGNKRKNSSRYIYFIRAVETSQKRTKRTKRSELTNLEFHNNSIIVSSRGEKHTKRNEYYIRITQESILVLGIIIIIITIQYTLRECIII